jgi:hypothetical protein
LIIEGFDVGVKRLGHESNHLPASGVKIKNVWVYTSTPSYVSMAWCLSTVAELEHRLATFISQGHCSYAPLLLLTELFKKLFRCNIADMHDYIVKDKYL